MLNLNEAKQYIDAINFQPIINKLVSGGWLESDAIATTDQYRKYLFLNVKYPDQIIPPSDDIDELWHNHILDTHLYIKDCDALFGKYKHHYPYFGIDEKSDMNDLNKAFNNTKELYLKEFGEELVATKSQYPTFIYSLAISMRNMKFYFNTLFKRFFAKYETIRESE
jgi:hypothetical protein